MSYHEMLPEGLVGPLLFASTAWMGLRWQRASRKPLDKEEAEEATATIERDKSLRLVRYLSDHKKRLRGKQYSYWESYTDNEEIFIQRFPKIELHVHFDGSFDPDFLFKYMKSNPASSYCFPVQSNPPWDPGTTLAVRSMVQKCQTSQGLPQAVYLPWVQIPTINAQLL